MSSQEAPRLQIETVFEIQNRRISKESKIVANLAFATLKALNLKFNCIEFSEKMHNER